MNPTSAEFSFNNTIEYPVDSSMTAEESANFTYEQTDESIGRMRRVGQFMLNLPRKISETTQKAVITARHEPFYFIKRSVQLGVVATQLSFANEMMRYGALTYALSNTDGGAIIGGLVLGATTFAVESASVLAGSSLLTTKSNKKTIEKVNGVIEKVIPDNIKMNKPIEFGLAMTGGSVVVLAEKQRENIHRTTRENIKYGLFTAGWMSAYFALEGAYIGHNSTEGSVLNPSTIGAFALALGISVVAAKVALKKGIKNQEDNHEG
jgi:hypothetical protein